MIDIKLLPEITKGKWTQVPQTSCRRFWFDTRTLQLGDAFIAITSETGGDGHAYLEEAEKKGASFAIVETVKKSIDLPQLQVKSTLKAFQQIAHFIRERFSGPVIGITGSVGKTSTKDFLKTLLGPRTLASYKNFNNTLGVPLTLQMLNNKVHDFGLVEMGINKVGEMTELTRCAEPDYAIITNIFPVHLEGLTDLESIAQEKVHISGLNCKKVFLFDTYLRYKALKSLGKKSFIVSKTSGDCVYSIEEKQGIVLKLETRNKTHTFQLPRWSKGMVENAVLALACALELGQDAATLQERLYDFEASDFREKWVFGKKKTYFADCYNSNPVSLLNSIEYFQSQADESKPRLYILSEMKELGSLSQKMHEEVGKKIKARPQDQFVFVGGESAETMRNSIPGISEFKSVCVKRTVDAKKHLDAFEGGIVYLKGAHSHAFESLVEQ